MGCRAVFVLFALVSPGLAQLNDSGIILKYSTLLGGRGNDGVTDLVVDATGSAYVVGETEPPSAREGGDPGNAFVAKLNPAGTAWVYYTEIGGSGHDSATGIAVDAAGNAYVVGITRSKDFPTTAGAYKTAPPLEGGGVFVLKLDPSGKAPVWATYLGPGFSSGIAVDAAGNSYVTGWTFYPAFPVTAGAFQTVWKGGNDVFVSKLKPDGSGLVYSTLLGSSDSEEASRIAVDGAGNAYLTGGTRGADFPTTAGVVQARKPGPREDPFVTKLNPSGSGLVYSTFLGGSSPDGGFDIAVDGQGMAYVTGITMSRDFPVTAGAFRTAMEGSSDAFLAKLSADATRLVYSTFLGGGQGTAVAVGASGEACVVGPSDPDGFPVTSGTLLHLADEFLACVNSAGSALRFATYLGTAWGSDASSVALDSQGGVYVAGIAGMNFPITPGAPQTAPNGGNPDAPFAADGFVLKIEEGKLPPGTVTSVPSASFFPYAPVAPESMVSAFGANLAAALELAQTIPLPTALGGVQVKVKDSAGVERLSSLIAVSPTQINYILPAGAAPGPATVTVLNQGREAGSGTVRVDTVAPGLFSANANGQGVAAAIVVRVAPNGTQSHTLTFDCSAGQGKCTPTPINMGGPDDQVILVLFGTGIRNRSSPDSVRLIGTFEQLLEVQYAGPQNQYPGLDQINLRIKAKPDLPGDTIHKLQLFVDGRATNAVDLRFQ